MVLNKIRIIITPLLLIIYSSVPVYAYEIRSKYSSISYKNHKLLQNFNNRLNMGKLNYLMRGKRAFTVEDEVKNKLDVITEKIEQILEMYPKNLHYSLTLCSDMDQVQTFYLQLNKKNWKRPGFYSPTNNKMYVSVKDTKLSLIAHEIGHVIVANYFENHPPVKVHELLAQYAEKHIED